MKKYLLSTFCSAFVVPGLGQVINEQIKKGLLLLGLVFILLTAAGIKLALVVSRLATNMEADRISPRGLAAGMTEADLSLIWVLVLIFAVIWIYAIIDAFWVGVKIEQEKAKGKDEIPTV